MSLLANQQCERTRLFSTNQAALKCSLYRQKRAAIGTFFQQNTLKERKSTKTKSEIGFAPYLISTIDLV
jgi:hypothetical protein